jgi:4-amino-4-deoxy-L-arabinose transferase-like glycosyltransferase
LLFNIYYSFDICYLKFVIKMLKKYLTPILLILISFLSVCLFLYKMNVSPPALNADEAANGYDAYSILKTGKDQYGNFLPLRFKSFGDYKLPLLTYLAVPFIKIFGLTETGIRMVNFPFVLFFPAIIFLLIQELLNKKNVSLLAAFLSAFAPGLQLLGRQAHEGFMTAFFLTLSFCLFLKFFKKQSLLNFSLFGAGFLFTLFGYHSSRLWAGFFLMVFIYFAIKKNVKKLFLIGFIFVLFLFGITDIIYKPTRVQNLLFFNNLGFSLKINELRSEGGSRLIYNKLTVGARDLILGYMKYLSPQLFVTDGDNNIRFGFPGISPITPVEYLFIFIGLFFLFKNKEKWRYLILLMFLFSPISASLSWLSGSITRSIFIFIPTLIISGYGMVNFFNKKSLFIISILTVCYFIFLFYSWDFYLNHYPKRAVVLRSWQAGYKELANYIKTNYNRFDKFYITKKNGQPYIFLLFYLQYPPDEYQKVSSLSSADQYGFGQVEKFDKFIFDLPNGRQTKNSAVIGFPDDFSDAEKPNLKDIKVGTETIFLIKEIK